METITESINNLIVKTSGGILIFWMAGLVYFGKILNWCGKKIAEGANKDLIKQLMPSIAEYVEKKIEEFKNETIATLSNELTEVKKLVEEYKKVKHNIETENKYLRSAIKESDVELLSVIKDYLNEKK